MKTNLSNKNESGTAEHLQAFCNVTRCHAAVAKQPMTAGVARAYHAVGSAQSADQFDDSWKIQPDRDGWWLFLEDGDDREKELLIVNGNSHPRVSDEMKDEWFEGTSCKDMLGIWKFLKEESSNVLRPTA